MKSLHLLLVAGLALAGCQNGSDLLVNSPGKNAGAGLQKTANLEATLQELAQQLAQEPSWLNARLFEEMKRAPVPIARLPIAAANAAPSRLESEGRIYDVTVEACLNSKFGSAEPLRVAVDPERFCADEAAAPAYFLDRNQSRVMSERIDKAAAEQKGLTFPLVLVTLQDRTETSFQEMSAGSKIFREAQTSLSQSSGSFAADYLAITKLRLHTAHDGGGLSGLEEFELYVKEGNGPTDYVLPVTIHVFNGVRRLDAAGRRVLYPDINLIDTTYVFEQPIALWPLSNATPISIVPLEDDCIAGQDRNAVYPNPYMKTYTQEYHRPSNSMLSGRIQGYDLAGPKTCLFSSNDDTYDRGTFSDWTASSTPEQEISIDLGDLQIWVKKLTLLPRVHKPLSEE